MDGQFSDDFKAQYRAEYGINMSRRRPDYTRCAHEVGDGFGWHQCTRKNGHGPHGAWCKTHDPDAVKAKSEARSAKWRAECDQRDRLNAATAALEPALRQIAAGHNDPRSLAESVIAALDAARTPPEPDHVASH